MLPGAHFDLNMLVILAQLLRTRSVTRTARHMGVSQPAISRSLAQLRDLLGDPLLVRTGTGMALTRRGEELAEPVEAWLAATTTLLAPPHFDPAELQRRFRIASTDFGVAAVVAPALGAIMRAAPGTSIDIVPLGSDMARALTAGEVDLVISGLDPDPAVTYERFLFLEGFRCVALPDHPLMAGGSAEPLDVEAFLAWPHISFTVSDTGFDRIDHRLGSLAARRHVIARREPFAVDQDQRILRRHAADRNVAAIAFPRRHRDARHFQQRVGDFAIGHAIQRLAIDHGDGGGRIAHLLLASCGGHHDLGGIGGLVGPCGLLGGGQRRQRG